MNRHRGRRRFGKRLSRFTVTLASYVLGYTLGMMRLTYRRRLINDCRARIYHETGKRYVFAILHAHQVAALSMTEVKAGSLVSRSRDGDLIVPALRACQCVPIRGSSGVGAKGGATALVELIRHVRRGYPAVVAVDGPRGPRGKVQPGAAMIAHKAGVPVVPVVLIPNRRWIFTKTWDRLQLLKPFSRVTIQFGDPIYPNVRPEASSRELVEEMTCRIETSLRAMEAKWDADEAALASEIAGRGRAGARTSRRDRGQRTEMTQRCAGNGSKAA